MEPNPHYAILRSLYDLYLSAHNDRQTLERVRAIAWALGYDLGYDYAYYDLGELISDSLSSSGVADQHYANQVEGQLRAFEEHQQGIVTERRKQYEADRANFPDIGAVLSFGVRRSVKDPVIIKSFSVLLFIENNDFTIRGGTAAIRKQILATIKGIDQLDLEYPRYSLEKVCRHLPQHTGTLKLMDWHLVTRDDAFPPYLF